MTFESEFSKLQSDMVSVCLEYCERKCDRIYIHIVIYADTVSSDFFFQIAGSLRRKGKLNGVDPISPLRQKEALKIVATDAKEILRLCEKHNRPVPSEIKIDYNNQSGAATCDYGYDTFHNESAREMTEKWFNTLDCKSEVDK